MRPSLKEQLMVLKRYQLVPPLFRIKGSVHRPTFDPRNYGVIKNMQMAQLYGATSNTLKETFYKNHPQGGE